jgi:DNA-binding NarL/FixJ family response regulator
MKNHQQNGAVSGISRARYRINQSAYALSVGNVSNIIQRESIVVVEKREIIKDCLERCIGDELGYPVVSFSTLESWRESADKIRAMLIVVSVMGALSHSAQDRDCELVRKLCQMENCPPVVVLADPEDIDYVSDSLRSGVRGYVPAASTLTVAIEAIRLVLLGGAFVPAASLLAEGKREVKAADSGGELNTLLTERQNAVVNAIRQGKANKLIADDLKISENTVKVHLHNIMKRLRAKNRTEVALITSGLPIRDEANRSSSRTS